MQQATGELSMTAIAVVAIAAIGVVFTTLIWPSIKANITRSTYCTQSHRCDNTSGTSQTCYYYDENNVEQSVICPTK